VVRILGTQAVNRAAARAERPPRARRAILDSE
jgi:hypothetical protein